MSRRNRFHKRPSRPPAPSVAGLEGVDVTSIPALELLGRGKALLEQGNPQAAAEVFMEIDRLHPGHALASHLAGMAFREGAKSGEAAWLLARSLEGLPLGATQTNLGLCLQDLGRHGDAALCYEEALRLSPGLLLPRLFLGHCHLAQGNLPEALVTYAQVLAAIGTNPEERHNAAACAFFLDRWTEGWDLMESRIDLPLHKASVALPPDPPLWTGQPIAGKTLLVYGEQGLGDTIQMLRYDGWLRELGAWPIWYIQAPLVRLAKANGLDARPDDGPTPAADYVIRTMSLPKMHGTTPDTVPSPDGYLVSGVTPTERDIYTIGYVEAGSRTHSNDKNRSTTLAQWAPLFTVPGLRWVSFTPGRHGFSPKDFLETAQRMATCDLLITVDTSVAHLAGALGVPCWVLLATPPDWRWGLVEDTTPWYRRVTLYRQPVAGDWASVFQRVRADLLPAATIPQQEAA